MKKKEANLEAIHDALSRSVDSIYPSREALAEHLATGKKFKIYLGIDPTGAHLHVGHLSNFLILKRLAAVGAKIVVLIGDFTAQIGDPTDKVAMRQPMTAREIEKNLRTFKKQISTVLPVSGRGAVSFVRNSTWLRKMNFEETVKLAHHVTVQQMIERDMFQDRLRNGKPIGLHEFLYPLMQGYDSVGLDTDGELGGTDQTFNMLMGRDLLRVLKNKNKFVITSKLLINPRTGKKLAKTDGSLVDLDMAPEDMFGKLMSLEDEMMFPLAEQCTEMPLSRIEDLKEALAEADLNPRDAKMEIAYEVVAVIHGKKAAEKARENFVKLFSKKEIAASELPELLLSKAAAAASGGVTPAFIVKRSDATKSSAYAWRLVEQGGFEVAGEKVVNPKEVFRIEDIDGKVVKIGKHLFFRIKIR